MTISAGFVSFVFLLNGAPLQASTKSIFNYLHHTNQMRLQIGRLAQQKGDSSEVKDFGKHLIYDYGRADTDVVDTALAANVRLKRFRLGWSEKRVMKRLESASGKDFDLIFAIAVADDNKKDIDQLQSAQKGLKPGSVSYELVSKLLMSKKMKNLNRELLGWGLPSSDLGRPR